MTDFEKQLKKLLVRGAQTIKEKMTVEEKIAFLNTPYKDIPDILQPGMVQHPQTFKFIPMKYKHIGKQNETFGARLVRYRENWHLTREQFCDIANEFGKLYKVKITKMDMIGYEDFNICPKIDKMTIIAETMDLPMTYFAGYGPSERNKAA